MIHQQKYSKIGLNMERKLNKKSNAEEEKKTNLFVMHKFTIDMMRM